MKLAVLFVLSVVAANVSAVLAANQPLNFGDKNYSYYIVTPDVRRCAAPHCGGVFIQKLNHSEMRCPDGKRARQCYAPKLDLSKLSVPGFNLSVSKVLPRKSSAIIVKGELVKRQDQNNEVAAELSAITVFERMGKSSKIGKFWSLSGSPSRCITQPCFFGSAQLINAKFKRSFSAYDLSKAGLRRDQIEAVRKSFKQGHPIVARAIRRSFKDASGRGIRFVPTEIYMPIQRSQVEQKD